MNKPRNPIANVPNPNEAELVEFLIGLDHLKSHFRTDALKGRRAVVFGALWKSIGAACARMLADFGCDLVVLQGESEKAIAPTYAHLKERGYENTHQIIADLSKPGSGKETALGILQAFPDIDICLYISGLSLYYPYTDPDPIAAQTLFQVNVISAAEVYGVFLKAHLARLSSQPKRRLDLGGCSSIQSLAAVGSDAGFYSATKAGVEQYLRGLGVQYANKGVQTHCVAPGCVDTARHRSTASEFAITRDIGNQTPWGEIAPCSVIAEAFLAAICASNYRIASHHIVDGGWSISARVNATAQTAR